MKVFLPILIAFIFIAGCVKKDTTCGYIDSTTIAPTSEVLQLRDSLNLYGITASQHPSGFLYKINAQGSGTGIANLCTNITVNYKGKFFNGKIFDSTKSGEVINFQLGEVIVGWQKGVPLVSKGGDIDLYIPPAIGFGPIPRTDPSSGDTIIPANSYLIFNVHIVDIQ